MVESPSEVSQHLSRIEREGYTIIEDVLPLAVVDELVERLLELETQEAIVPAKNLFEGHKTIRIYNLLARGAIFQQIAENPRILPIVEGVLDRGCLVSSLSSIAILPGEVAQPIHADDMLIPLPKPHPALVCNTMWALTDFREENGATRLCPGTHKAAYNPDPFGAHESLAAVMRRGSVLVYHGSLWHGGGANRTAERRIGVAMNYCAGYIRQQENQLLGVPLEVARGFSPRLRRLVGYGLYKKLLGHIDKCSPVDILDGVGPRKVVGEV